ncbi:unnamed protein product, partial [Symbiodinium microadriaticum]
AARRFRLDIESVTCCASKDLESRGEDPAAFLLSPLQNRCLSETWTWWHLRHLHGYNRGDLQPCMRRCFVPKYPAKTPTARPCKGKANDVFDAIERDGGGTKAAEVAAAKTALLQSQLDQKNRDLLAARGEMSARYMLERYVDKIKAEAHPRETRTKPLLRQVQQLQKQSPAAKQMVDAVKACATSLNQPSTFLSDLFAHVSGQFHFPNWCGPGIKVSPSLNKAERCVLEKLTALEGLDIKVDDYEETDGE